METGTIDRRANLVGMDGADALIFDYEVQLGDYPERLDYWTSYGLVRTAANAFDFNGNGYIKKLSLHPTVDADLHLKPSSGYLDGTRLRSVNEGIAEYSDLSIAQRGYGYKVRFRATPENTSWPLETGIVVDVDESIEDEIRETTESRYSGNLFGKSVAIDGDVAAVGSPRRRNSVPEIQVLSVIAESEVVEPEIQVIGTYVDVENATKTIQSFTTRADALPGGNFSLAYISKEVYLYAAPFLPMLGQYN